MAIFIIVVLCICKQISIAIEIIKCAGDYVRATPLVLLVPLVSIFVFLAYILFWIIVGLYLYTIGTPVSGGSSPFADI